MSIAWNCIPEICTLHKADANLWCATSSYLHSTNVQSSGGGRWLTLQESGACSLTLQVCGKLRCKLAVMPLDCNIPMQYESNGVKAVIIGCCCSPPDFSGSFSVGSSPQSTGTAAIMLIDYGDTRKFRIEAAELERYSEQLSLLQNPISYNETQQSPVLAYEVRNCHSTFQQKALRSQHLLLILISI